MEYANKAGEKENDGIERIGKTMLGKKREKRMPIRHAMPVFAAVPNECTRCFDLRLSRVIKTDAP